MKLFHKNKNENPSKDALDKTENYANFDQTIQADQTHQSDQTDQTDRPDRPHGPDKYYHQLEYEGVVHELSNMQNCQSPVSISP